MVCPNCQFDNEEGTHYCRKCSSRLAPGGTTVTLDTITLDTPPPAPSAYSKFAGRFRILEEVGTGSMGTVYKALDEKIHDIVSLKVLKPAWASDRKSVERFQNEIRLARKISHKNICRLYDFGQDDGHCYLTMEFVTGQDLKTVLKMMKPLSGRTAVGIARQICEGLAEAHRLGITHRDLKPSNIMINSEGTVRIMDFGIAHSLETDGDPIGAVVGTPEYMSPEQAEGKTFDARSDIYSLGVILFEMVTGQRPFNGGTFFGLAIKHKVEKPRDPRDFAPHLPRPLARLILRCLEKNPDMRYPNAGALLKDLAAIDDALSAPKTPSSARTSFFSFVSRIFGRRRWLTALAVGLLIILIGFSIATVKKTGPLPPLTKKMLAVLPFENLGQPEDEYISDGITDEVISRLSNLQGLGVISRTSAMVYKTNRKTVPQIGRELGVEYVLEGSVRWDHGKVGKSPMRVTPQLIRVADDTPLWTDTYDVPTKDIFALQSEIAEEVARKLDLALLEPERKSLKAQPTENLNAYDAYLQARKMEYTAWTSWKSEDLLAAVNLFEKAINNDPGFALAYADLSQIHSRIYFFGFDRTDQRLAKARAAADKALSLQPELPEAKLALAYYYYWGYLDYESAVQLLESIRKTRPNMPLETLGYIWRRQGRWERSLAMMEEAFKLNPRYPQLAYEIGLSYLAMRRYESAEEWFNRALSINPVLLTPQLQKAALAILAYGDTAKARNLLASAPAHFLTQHMWLKVDLAERNWQGALKRLAAIPVDIYEGQHFYFHKDLAYAEVYRFMGDIVRASSHAEKAKRTLETAIKKAPDDPRLRAALGLASAYLGRKEEAISEGLRAVNLYPVSMDAAQGSTYVHILARIYTILNEKKKAIELLQYLLSIPTCEYIWDIVSLSYLRLNPEWDSLRSDLRFQGLKENRF